MQAYKCPYCPDVQSFFSPSQCLLERHIKLVHSHEPGFRIQCNRSYCSRVFSHFRTYQNHLLQHCDEYVAGEEENNEENRIGFDRNEDSGSIEVNLSEPNNETLAIPNLTDFCAKWILKLSEFSSVIGLPDIFLPSNETVTPFSQLMSFYQQLLYYKQNYNLIEPRRIVLKESRTIHRRATGKVQILVKKQELIYIPIIETLQQLLKNSTILKEVMIGHQSMSASHICDYCDGYRYKSHELFSSSTPTVQIFLYYDEVELCNPLGSKRSKHKIGAFYYVLGNMQPKFRQRLSNIQLLALVKSRAVTEYGMNHILDILLQDIKKLENGIHVDGISWPLKGTIAVCSADNPASNGLGGFKMSGSSFRMCRHCLGTESDIQSKFRECDFQLRSAKQYSQHCDLIENEPELSSHYSTTFGINHRSSWIH